MKTTLTLATLVVIFFFISCKKEDSKSVAVSGLPVNDVSSTLSRQYQVASPNGNSRTVLYRATDHDLSAFETTFNKSVLGQITGSGRPGPCPIISDHNAMMEEIDLVGGNLCNGTMLCDVTYLWMVFELPVVANPSPTVYAAGNFTMVDQNSNSYTASVVVSSSQSPLTCNPLINPCGHVFRCEVKFTNVPQSALTGPTTTSNTVSGPGPYGCGMTTTLPPKSVSTAIPNSFYLINPARAFVIGYTNSILVFTDCSNSCQYLLYQCPTGGIFEYTLHNSGTWPNAPITLTANGGNVPGLPANTLYDYRCTLNYSFGSSLQLTGTVQTQ